MADKSKTKVKNAKRTVDGRIRNRHRCSARQEEEITLRLIILIIVMLLVFGRGGSYYWRQTAVGFNR